MIRTILQYYLMNSTMKYNKKYIKNIIVIEHCFLLVLANITFKLFLSFLLDDIENLFCNVVIYACIFCGH